MNNHEIEELTYKLTNILALLKLLSSLEESIDTVYVSMICADYCEKLEVIIDFLHKKIK